MEQYTLKLSSGTSYRLYLGSTLVTDSSLNTLLATAGSAYFSFDFNGSSPSSTTTLQIVDSNDQIILSNSGVTVVEGKNYKGTWSNMASTFDSFVELSGKALDESQVSFLMKKIKEPVGTSSIEDGSITNAKLTNNSVANTNLQDGSVTGAANSATLVTGSKIALDTVGTPNLRDSAVTAAKIANDAVTSDKINWTTFTSRYATAADRSATATTYTTVTTVTVSPGTYYVIGKAEFDWVEAKDTFIDLRIFHGTTVIDNCALWQGKGRHVAVAMGAVTFTSNTTIGLQYKKEISSASVIAYNFRLAAIRIR